ncbi:MAG: toprim domain-containing protein, partial [Acutalibacteraceae bacterium]
ADEAGQKATQRAIGIFSSIGMKLNVVNLTGGKDPDEILRKFGPERFRNLIDGASNDIEYELLKAKKDYDLETADGKMKYLTKACEILADTGDSIAQDIYASKLAEELDVEKQTISVRIGQLKRKRMNVERKRKFSELEQKAVSQARNEAMKSGTTVRVLKAQKRLLALLFNNPDFLPLSEGKITQEDFSDGICGKLYQLISEKIKNGESLELGCFAETLGDSEMSTLVGIIRSADGLTSTKKEYSDCINVILEEKNKEKNVSAGQMNDEEFMKAMAEFNKKKKSN